MQNGQFTVLSTSSLIRRTTAALLMVLPLFTATALTGCGGSLYEQRLKNTEKLFRRMELLDSHLKPAWNDRGIALRVPQQFNLIPAPAAVTSDGEQFAVLDERQPDFLNVELPGLRAAFRATLAVFAEGSEQAERHAGYLYILSNQGLPKPTVVDGETVRSSGPTAATFHADTVTLLANALHLTPPESWPDQQIPIRNEEFVAPIRYKRIELIPLEPIRGLATEFTAYLYQQGEIQIVVLWVIPQGVASSEKLRERIDFSLETLTVTGDKVGTEKADSGQPGASSNSGF